MLWKYIIAWVPMVFIAAANGAVLQLFSATQIFPTLS